MSDGTSAADDGAPPWTGATWTARMRSAVSEKRRQKSQIHGLLSLPLAVALRLSLGRNSSALAVLYADMGPPRFRLPVPSAGGLGGL